MSEIMADTRDKLSRLSVSSPGSGAAETPRCANSMEVIHVLYQKLEPQITPSYRPHATYVPPTAAQEQDRPSQGDKMSTVKASKVKTAQLVIGAVAEFQKRRDSTKRKQSLIAEAAKKAVALEKAKNVSQSLPNLTESDT